MTPSRVQQVMKPRRTLVPVILLLPLLLLAACGSAAARKGEAEGRASAERDIAAGTPCLLGIGLPMPFSSSLDPVVGVPQYSRGCVVDDESTAYVAAYNETILAAHAEGRLAGMTFADRATTREAVAARFEREGGVLLTPTEPAADAPGGRFRVELAPRFGKPDDTPYLFVLDRDRGTRQELQFLSGPEVRVLFDAEGRTLFVRDEGYQVFLTFDLARGIDLQAFPDPGRGW